MDSGHEQLEQIAERLGGLALVRLQGVLAGGLCAGRGFPASGPGSLGALLALGQPLSTDERRELDGAAGLVEFSLRDPDYGFAPLIPDDFEPLPLRAEALAEWCDAFIEGFSACLGGQSPGEVSAETSEILGDLGAIAGGLDPESLDGDDESDERDFWQIAEFVRIAAISIFAERASPPGEPLH